MNRIKGSIVTLALGLMLTAAAHAEETLYTSGKVTQFTAGKSIAVTDVDGARHTFVITGDTTLSEELSPGADVEIESLGNKAVYIEVISSDTGEDAPTAKPQQ